jgi:hypothetical protein
MSSLNVKNISLLNFSFEWISSLHFLIFVSTDSVICDEAIFAWSHSRRENIVKMTICHSQLWMSFFMREILRSSCETCLFSHYYLWNRSFRSIQNRNRVLCEIFFEIHRKRSSFMNEKCCKQWLMNAKVNRKQNEDKTLSNSRFKRLFFFLVFAQAFFAIHSFIFFFQKIFKNFLKLFIMSFVWKSFLSLNIIKLDRFFSNTLKIVLDKKKNSKCCQRCFKFLTMKFVFKCVFDVDKSICNRCAILNVACFVVRLS